MRSPRTQSNYNYYDSESDPSDNEDIFDPEDDCEGDRHEEIRRLREENKPIPRKLRTRNLLLTEEWCQHWGTAEGIREIVQNFFDGICTAFDIMLDTVVFEHRVQGGSGKKTWKEIWTATNGRHARHSVEYGKITYDRKKGSLVIVNERVTLSQSVLFYGKSDKRYRSDLIGGYGEGMKIGILRLVSEGCGVRYRTGGEIWNFFMGKSRGSSDETLHYRTKDAKNERTNLEVVIRCVEDDDFEVETFLPLSRDVQKPVMGSVCQAGYLLQAHDRPDLTANRVYVKGLYVHDNPDMRVSVNFAQAGVNRDRNMRMVDREFQKTLAKIWGTVFAFEKDLDDRPYTSKYLNFANDERSVEFRCVHYMNERDAECLYKEIIKQKPKAFLYKRGAVDEAKLISSSLKKEPYPVHENLLKLLNELPEVMTVHEAQEKAFLSDSSECPPSVYALPLARMITTYTTRITGPDKIVNVKFHKPATSEIDALLKDNTLICSQSLVQVEYENEKQSVHAKLDALRSVERELQKCFDSSEHSRIYFDTMEFVASEEFRTYLCSEVCTPNASPITTDSNEPPGPMRRGWNCDNGNPIRVGMKRTVEEDVHEGSNKGSGPSTAGTQSPKKKQKAAVGQEGAGINPSQHRNKNRPMIDTSSSENDDEHEADEIESPDDGSEHEVETQRGTTARELQPHTNDARRLGENQPQPRTILITKHNGSQAATERATKTPPVQRNVLPNPPERRTTTTRNIRRSAQRMRFVLDQYEIILMHELTPTPSFAVEQNFGGSADGAVSRDVSLNLVQAFPCCRTDEGDLIFTASIRKQSQVASNTRQ